MNMPALWDLCINFLWEDEYADDMAKFFKTKGVRKIFDVAGGTGFPILNLKQRGFDVVYSDGNLDMVEYFQRRIGESSIDIPTFHMDWCDLPKNFSLEFDAILCRGNSIVYVDSWEKDNIGANSIKRVKKSLIAFRDLLKKGGFLYIDITSNREFQSPSNPIEDNFGVREIDGKQVSIFWRIFHDSHRKLRRWENFIEINGTKHKTVMESLLLDCNELKEMIHEVGFSSVNHVSFLKETNYDALLCEK